MAPTLDVPVFSVLFATADDHSESVPLRCFHCGDVYLIDLLAMFLIFFCF